MRPILNSYRPPVFAAHLFFAISLPQDHPLPTWLQFWRGRIGLRRGGQRGLLQASSNRAQTARITLPETNSSHLKKRSSQKGRIVSQPSMFPKVREGNIWVYIIWFEHKLLGKVKCSVSDFYTDVLLDVFHRHFPVDITTRSYICREHPVHQQFPVLQWLVFSSFSPCCSGC